MSSEPTSRLVSWDTVRDVGNWSTLLLGNGFSINIWQGFSYAQLLSMGQISPHIRALFDHLDTTDFETVLYAVQQAVVVAEALDIETETMHSAYDEIKQSLISAVKSTHVAHEQIPSVTLQAVQQELWGFNRVFSTNYDWITYWALMHDFDSANPKSKDFIWKWSESGLLFDINDTKPWETNAVLIHHLHGALYLWRDAWSAREGKIVGVQGEITQIIEGPEVSETRRPLFVSEGDTKSKVKAILNSRYLTFCLEAFREDVADTVVFGHSLSATDTHIVEALNSGTRRKIALSLFPGEGQEKIEENISRLEKLLPNHELFFFDSTTHPLGCKELQIKPRPDSVE